MKQKKKFKFMCLSLIWIHTVLWLIAFIFFYCALNSNNLLLDLTILNQISSIIGIFKSQGSLNNKRIFISYYQDEYCFYNYDKNNRKSSINKENIDKNIRFYNAINLYIFKNKIYSTLSKIERKINQMEDFGFNSTQSIESLN